MNVFMSDDVRYLWIRHWPKFGAMYVIPLRHVEAIEARMKAEFEKDPRNFRWSVYESLEVAQSVVDMSRRLDGGDWAIPDGVPSDNFDAGKFLWENLPESNTSGY